MPLGGCILFVVFVATTAAPTLFPPFRYNGVEELLISKRDSVADFDLDGLPDIYHVHGLGVANQLRLSSVHASSEYEYDSTTDELMSLGTAGPSRVSCAADFDADGDIDILLGGESHDKFEFVLLPEPASFHTAVESCVTIGGTLASMHSPEDADAVLLVGQGTNAFWIGLSQDVLTGHWDWNDGTLFGADSVTWAGHSHHFSTFPSESSLQNRCVAVSSVDGSWLASEYDCLYAELPAVCRIPSAYMVGESKTLVLLLNQFIEHGVVADFKATDLAEEIGLTGFSVYGCAVADFDFDGDIDICVAGSSGGASAIIRNELMSQTGSLSWSLISSFPELGETSQCAFADLERDGDLDVVFTGVASDTLHSPISIVKSDYGSSFMLPEQTLVPGNQKVTGSVIASALSDFDGDGYADILLAVAGSPTITILRNAWSSSRGELQWERLVVGADDGTFTGLSILPDSNSGLLAYYPLLGNGFGFGDGTNDGEEFEAEVSYEDRPFICAAFLGNSRISLGDQQLERAVDDFGITLHAKIQGMSSLGSRMVLVEKGAGFLPGSAKGAGWSLFVTLDSSTQTFLLHFCVFTSGPSCEEIACCAIADQINSNVWHEIEATREGEHLTLTINGVRKANTFGVVGKIMGAGEYTAHAGAGFVSESIDKSYFSDFFVGSMAELRLWDRGPSSWSSIAYDDTAWRLPEDGSFWPNAFMVGDIDMDGDIDVAMPKFGAVGRAHILSNEGRKFSSGATSLTVRIVGRNEYDASITGAAVKVYDQRSWLDMGAYIAPNPNGKSAIVISGLLPSCPYAIQLSLIAEDGSLLNVQKSGLHAGDMLEIRRPQFYFTEISSLSGDAKGGDTILVAGRHFPTGDSIVYHAVFLNDNTLYETASWEVKALSPFEVEIITPMWPYGASQTTLLLFITREDGDTEEIYSNHTVHFDFFPSWHSKSTSRVSASGGEPITVDGFGFIFDDFVPVSYGHDDESYSEYSCRLDCSFGSMFMIAQVLSHTELKCETAPIFFPASEGVLSIQQNGVDIHVNADDVEVEFYAAWDPSSLIGTSIDTSGGSLVRVIGNGFATNGFLFVGEDACSTGFIAGYDEFTMTIGECAAECARIDSCKYFSFLEGVTCSRFNSDGCNASPDGTATGSVPSTYATYQKIKYTCLMRGLRNPETAFTSVQATVQSNSELKCITPPWLFAAQEVILTLLVNGEPVPARGDPNNVLLTMHASWNAASHSAIDARGGDAVVISGSGFDDQASDYACKFEGNNGYFVFSEPVTPLSSTELVCIPPVWHAGESDDVNIVLVRHGLGEPIVSHSDNSISIFASWVSLSLYSADSAGGDIIMVQGNGFRADKMYECVFLQDGKEMAVSEAHADIRHDMLSCITPTWHHPGGQTSFLVRRFETNEEVVAHSSNEPSFSFFASWHSKNIAHLNAAGSEEIIVNGYGFETGRDYFCNFVGKHGHVAQSDLATPLSTEILICISPVWISAADEGSMIVVDSEAIATSSDEVSFFTVYETWHSKSSDTGDAGGGDTLIIEGNGFDVTDGTYTCHFADIQIGVKDSSAPVHPISSTKIECVTPIWKSRAATVKLELMHAGKIVLFRENNTMLENDWFSFYASFYAINPRLSTAYGVGFFGSIDFDGHGFDVSNEGSSAYLCRFTDEINGHAIDMRVSQPESSELLKCAPPQWPYPASKTVKVALHDPRTGENIHPRGNVDVSFIVIAVWDYRIPDVFDARGGEIITIGGAGFDPNSDDYVCIFSSEENVATTGALAVGTSTHTLECSTPAWGDEFKATSVALTLMKNNVVIPTAAQLADYGELVLEPMVMKTEVNFFASWYDASLHDGDTAGGDKILISGHGFDTMSEDYQCVFSDANGNTASSLAVKPLSATSLECTTPAWLFAETITTMSVVKGADSIAGHTDANFHFFASWHTKDVSIGFANGGDTMTIQGNGFDARNGDYICRFATEVHQTESVACFVLSSTVMKCVIPEWYSFAAETTISVERASHRSTIVSNTAEGMDRYHFVANSIMMNAVSGDARGGEDIIISGFGFEVGAADYICTFSDDDGNIATSAIVKCQSSTELICETPTWYFGEGDAFVTLRKNDRVITWLADSSNKFYFFASWHDLSEAEADAKGGGIIEVFGFGFLPGVPEYECSFIEGGNTAISNKVAPVSSTIIKCDAPPWYFAETANVELNILRNGEVLSSHFGKSFTFFASWSSKSLDVTDARGGSSLVVHGHGFDTYGNLEYTCRFRDTDRPEREAVSSPTTPISSMKLICPVPVWLYSAVDTTMDVIRDNKVIVSHNFSLLKFTVSWSDLSTTSVDASGENIIIINGHGFSNDNGAQYTCQFTHPSGEYATSDSVMPVSSTELACLVPVWLFSETKSAVMSLLEAGVEVTQHRESIFHFRASWHSKSLDSGDCHGGENLVIFGNGFDSSAKEYVLQFVGVLTGNVANSVAAKPSSSEEILFVIPTWDFPETMVKIALFRTRDQATTMPETSAIFSEKADMFFYYIASWSSQDIHDADAAGGQRLSVEGNGFDATDAEYTCKFVDGSGNVAESAASQPFSSMLLVCVIPTWLFAATDTSVSVLRNGVELKKNTANNNMYLHASWSQRFPDKLDARGGETIVVYGNGFFSSDSDYTCCFGSVESEQYAESMAVSPFSSTELECIAPIWYFKEGLSLFALHKGGAAIVANLNEEHILQEVIMWFASWSFKQIRASFVDAKGGDLWSIAGNGFDMNDNSYVCVFIDEHRNRASSLNVTPLSSTELQCIQPWWYFPASEQMELLLRRGSVVVVSHDFDDFAIEPTWSSKGLSAGDSRGGDTVSVHGAGFDPNSSDYFCRFTHEANFLESNDVAPLSTTMLLCTTPSWIFASTTTLMSVHKRSFGELESKGNATFVMWESWHSIGANIGDVTGGAALPVHGAGFDTNVSYTCRFTDSDGNEMSTLAQRPESSTDIKCVTPAWEYRPGYVNVRLFRTISPSILSLAVVPVSKGFTVEQLFLGGLYGVATTHGSDLTMLCYLNRVTGVVDVVSARHDLQYISRGASASFDGYLFFSQHNPSDESSSVIKQSLSDGEVIWVQSVGGYSTELIESRPSDGSILIMVRSRSGDRALICLDASEGSILSSMPIYIHENYGVLSGVSALSESGILHFVLRVLDEDTPTFVLSDLDLVLGDVSNNELSVTSVQGLVSVAGGLVILTKDTERDGFCFVKGPEKECTGALNWGGGAAQASSLSDGGVANLIYTLFPWPHMTASVVSLRSSSPENNLRSSMFALSAVGTDRRLANLPINLTTLREGTTYTYASDGSRRRLEYAHVPSIDHTWRFQLIGYNAANHSKVAAKALTSCNSVISCYECLHSYELDSDWASSCAPILGGGCASERWMASAGLERDPDCFSAHST